MSLSSFQKLMLISFMVCLPTLSFGLTGENIERFKKDCNMYWMKDGEKAADKTSFKNFGEKYCSCMSLQPLDSDSDMKESAKTCMSRTLLQITMENVEDDPGLDSLSEDVINTACLKEWDDIGTVLVGDKKGPNTAFCSCAAPKLNDMNAKRDKMTDEDWTSTINSIAKDCA